MPQVNLMQPNLTGRPAGGPHARLYREKAEIRDVKGTLRRLILYLGRRWRTLILVFFCALATTLITIIGTQLAIRSMLLSPKKISPGLQKSAFS